MQFDIGLPVYSGSWYTLTGSSMEGSSEMDVREAIEQRRAYRSLVAAEITAEMVDDLAHCASLAPSCFNKQPWRYVYVYKKDTLEALHSSLARGNEWARKASMIIAVYSEADLDCRIKGRDYFLFDTGLATAFQILRATELGLVAHPIAGFDEEGAKEILGIPAPMTLITLVMVGAHSAEIDPVLSEKQIEAERERPLRLPKDDYARVIG